MELKFKYKDRVKTKNYCGCYENATGYIQNYLTPEAVEDPTGFIIGRSLICNMYRVKFDAPVNISTDPENPCFVDHDVFDAHHLEKI